MNTLDQQIQISIPAASQCVARFSGDRISLFSRGARTVPISDTGMLFGAEDVPVTVVALNISKEPKIQYVLVMTKEAGNAVVNAIAGQDVNQELAESVLQELTNILGTAIANSLAVILQCDIKTSVPEVISDMSGAVFSTVISTFDSVDDNIICMDIILSVDSQPVACKSFLFFEDTIEEKLLCPVGHKADE